MADVLRPEMPYLAAAGVTVAASTYASGHLPALGKVALGVIGIIVVASATTGTKLAPVMQALGYLVLLAVLMRSATMFNKKGSKNG